MDLATSDFTAEELEFLADETPIFIVPRQSMPAISFIGGDVGPFRPARRTRVPFWLAMEMKRRGVCDVVAPDWLSVEHLKLRLEEERGNAGAFSEMPYHYVELAQNILEVCQDNVPAVTEVKALLQELKEERQRKARNGLNVLNPIIARMDNLAAMEINECRPFFLSAFETMRQLQQS